MIRLDIFGNFKHAIWQSLSDAFIMKNGMPHSKGTSDIFMLIHNSDIHENIYIFHPFTLQKLIKQRN